MARALQADEFGDVLEILPKDKLIAAGDDGDIAHTVRQQLFTASWIVEYVDRDEVDIFFRKKLFRSKAAASPRLEKQDEFFGGDGHIWGCSGG